MDGLMGGDAQYCSPCSTKALIQPGGRPVKGGRCRAFFLAMVTLDATAGSRFMAGRQGRCGSQWENCRHGF